MRILLDTHVLLWAVGDSDSLPEYDTLDRVLYEYIELRHGPKEIIEKGFDKALVDRVLKLVNTNERHNHYH